MNAGPYLEYRRRRMPPPGSLLDLALTLHPAHPAIHQDRQALLASRLGFAEVWLPVDATVGFPDPARLDELAAAAGTTRLGLVLSGGEAGIIGGLRRLAAAGGAGGRILLELVEVAAGPACVQAAGGAAVWRARVRLSGFDPATAGTVVAAPTRADCLVGIAVAAAQRAAAGLTAAEHPVIAALPASVGRTWNEAAARAGRDPRFAAGGGIAVAGGMAGADEDTWQSGLFGTYEQAQAQVLELAAAGADGLRVTVPDEAEVADLLAQVRSVVAGAGPVLDARRA
jgi:hypothetical protein